MAKCPECEDGCGKQQLENGSLIDCPTCHGTGEVPDVKLISVKDLKHTLETTDLAMCEIKQEGNTLINKVYCFSECNIFELVDHLQSNACAYGKQEGKQEQQEVDAGVCDKIAKETNRGQWTKEELWKAAEAIRERGTDDTTADTTTDDNSTGTAD